MLFDSHRHSVSASGGEGAAGSGSASFRIRPAPPPPRRLDRRRLARRPQTDSQGPVLGLAVAGGRGLREGRRTGRGFSSAEPGRFPRAFFRLEGAGADHRGQGPGGIRPGVGRASSPGNRRRRLPDPPLPPASGGSRCPHSVDQGARAGGSRASRRRRAGLRFHRPLGGEGGGGGVGHPGGGGLGVVSRLGIAPEASRARAPWNREAPGAPG